MRILYILHDSWYTLYYQTGSGNIYVLRNLAHILLIFNIRIITRSLGNNNYNWCVVDYAIIFVKTHNIIFK